MDSGAALTSQETGTAEAAAIPLDDLAEELGREFGAPVGLFDPRLGAWLRGEGRGPSTFPMAAELLGLPSRVTVRPGPPGSGVVWLILPAAIGGGDLLAVVACSDHPLRDLEGGARPFGPHCPEPALHAWGQAVANRLRAEADSRLARDEARRATREPSVADRLIRRLRVSDPPDRFQSMATAAVRHALGVEAVAWIPGSSREPVVVAGGVGDLRPEDFRALMSDPGAGSIWIANRNTPPLPSAVRRLAVAGADADSPAGWLAAVNTTDDRPFVAEVELLQTVANLVATQRANARLYGDLKDLLFGVIRSLTAAIDAKDPYTSGHSERVARIAVRLGEELGLSANARGDLYLMGLLHDVGKIGIEDEVLKKPGKLSPEEYRAIQSHVRIGVHILSDLKKLQHLLPGVAHHHEHLDGTGYPTGLSGDQIPLPARILAVADAYDAMSSSRPYRKRMTPEQIAEVFRKGAGAQWDPRVVEAAFACQADLERIRQKGLGESLRVAVDDALGRS